MYDERFSQGKKSSCKVCRAEVARPGRGLIQQSIGARECRKGEGWRIDPKSICWWRVAEHANHQCVRAPYLDNGVRRSKLVRKGNRRVAVLEWKLLRG